jgi:hypothetical protein
MIPERLLSQIVNKIHSIPQLGGCAVGLYGNNQSRMLHLGQSVTPYSDRIIVIVEEVWVDDEEVLKDNEKWAATPGGSPDNVVSPIIVTNRSKLGPELIGAGISCTLTVVSALGVAGGAAAELPSGGTSTFLVVVAWTGLVTQGIQCANGLVRIGAIMRSPDDNTLDRWDNDDTYKCIIFLVDLIGVASTIASLPAGARKLFLALAHKQAFASRKLSFEALKRMNRAERARVLSEVFDEAAQMPSQRKTLVEALKAAQITDKSLGRGAISVRHAQGMMRIISEETVTRLQGEMKGLFWSAASIGGSGTPATWTGSASGSVNTIATGQAKDTLTGPFRQSQATPQRLQPKNPTLSFVINIIDAQTPIPTPAETNICH